MSDTNPSSNQQVILRVGKFEFHHEDDGRLWVTNSHSGGWLSSAEQKCLREWLNAHSPDETSDVQATLEDVYRSLCAAWDNRTLPASVLSADQFTRMREALGIPFPGYAKPGSPVEPTPAQLPCTLTGGCWLELGHDGHCD